MKRKVLLLAAELPHFSAHLISKGWTLNEVGEERHFRHVNQLKTVVVHPVRFGNTHCVVDSGATLLSEWKAGIK